MNFFSLKEKIFFVRKRNRIGVRLQKNGQYSSHDVLRFYTFFLASNFHGGCLKETISTAVCSTLKPLCTKVTDTCTEHRRIIPRHKRNEVQTVNATRTHAWTTNIKSNGRYSVLLKTVFVYCRTQRSMIFVAIAYRFRQKVVAVRK